VTLGDIVFVTAYLSNAPIVVNGPGGSVGGGDVNVSADIFVGVALVLCLAVGWIAGAQR